MLSFFFCDSHHKTAAVRLLSEKKKYKKTSKLFLQILTINVKTIKAIQNLEMPCFILQYLSSSINTISDQLLAYYSTQVYDHLSGQILIKQWWYLRVGMKQSFFFFFVTFRCVSQLLLSDSNTIWKLSFVAEKLISEIKKELNQLSAWIWSWEGNTMALDSLWPWTVIEKTDENIMFLYTMFL